MTLYLIRHGETTGDIEDRYGGDYEDNLTEKGRAQVAARIPLLTDKHVRLILSSPRIRALESADIIADALGVPVQVLPDWRERNMYGILTGMRKSDAREKFPEAAALAGSYKNTLPEGEAYGPFRARVERALDAALASDGNIVVITHGGPIACILRERFGKELKKTHDCAMLTITSENGKTRLVEADGVDFT